VIRGSRRRVAVPGAGYVCPMPGSSESDVPVDTHVARSRETGGAAGGHPDDRSEGDASATTGTGEGEEFVGRVTGPDLGYAGETGAEARAEAGEVNP
jgi:hypothetical protein